MTVSPDAARLLTASVFACLLLACGGGSATDEPTPGTPGEITENAGPVPDAETPSPGASE